MRGLLVPLRHAWAMFAKDLLIEVRTREILYSVVLFALLVVVVFAFALLGQPGRGQGAAPGILWVSCLFAGTLGLSRSAGREREADALTGLTVSPASRAGLFVGKAAANMAWLMLTQALLLPLVALFFGVDFLPRLGWHLLALGLGSVGFVSLGTLFSMMLLSSRLREVLLPLVFYPAVAPVLIGGVKASEALLAGDAAAAGTWLRILLACAAVFGTASAWAFGWTLEE